MFWFHHESHANSFRKIAITFFVLSLLLVGIVFYISFAWATITITPKAVSMQEGFVIDVLEQSDAQNRDALSGVIIEKDLEIKGTFQPTGEESQTVQRARGVITILNQSGTSQQLRASTRLQMEDGTLFRTQQYILVPAGGRGEAPVLADEAKELGDLSSTRFTLPGLNSARASQVYGVGFSPSALRSTSRKALSQSDIDSALTSLEDELKTMMTSSLHGQFQGSATMQNPTFLITVRPTTVARSAEVADPVESFTARMVAHVTAVVYDRSELQQKVIGQLTRKLGPGYDLIPPSDADISVEVDSVEAAQKKALLKIVVTTSRIRNADSADFTKSNLVGLSAEALTSYFQSFPDISSAEVQFTPFWVTSAPYLTDHIHILLKRE